MGVNVKQKPCRTIPVEKYHADANLNSKQANVYLWIIHNNYCYYVD